MLTNPRLWGASPETPESRPKASSPATPAPSKSQRELRFAPVLARVCAAFFVALRNSAFPFVRTAFCAAAFRLLAPRFFAALFACFDSAAREAVDRGSRWSTSSRAFDRRVDFFLAALVPLAVR